MGPPRVETRGDDRTAAEKLGLLVGFLSLAVATYLARTSPARGYEVSIYRATPVEFWAGVALAMAVSLVVAVATGRRGHRALALFLGGATTVAVAGLPLVRGYAYYGTSDALTHLGWAKDVRVGRVALADVYYPAVHSLGLVFEGVAGQDLPRTMLVGVLAVLTVYLVFVPLCVAELTDDPRGPVVGAFAAFLLAPINHVAVNYMAPHPVSEAILLSPLVLYLLVVFLDSPPTRGWTPHAVLLALVSATTVLYHSMVTAALLVFLGSVALTQFVYRRYVPGGHRLAARPVYGQAAFLLVVFVLWNLRFTVVGRTATLMTLAFRGALLGDSGPGAVVGQRSESLAGVGSGLPEVFAKLFLPTAVFGLLACWLVLYSLRHWRDRRLARVRLLGVGAVGLGLYSLPFFVGNVSRLFFRYFGFLAVFATVIGSLAVVRLASGGADRSRGRQWGPPAGAALVAGFAVLLVVSTLVVFPSPYVFQSNDQVSERTLSGYRTAFEHRSPDVLFAGVRSGPQRYLQAVYGRNGVPGGRDRLGFYRSEGSVPPEALGSLPAHFESDRYLVVTSHDRRRELVAYRGLRYTDEQLDRVADQPGVDRVVANGGVQTYYVDSARGS